MTCLQNLHKTKKKFKAILMDGSLSLTEITLQLVPKAQHLHIQVLNMHHQFTGTLVNALLIFLFQVLAFSFFLLSFHIQLLYHLVLCVVQISIVVYCKKAKPVLPLLRVSTHHFITTVRRCTYIHPPKAKKKREKRPNGSKFKQKQKLRCRSCKS